MQLAARIAADEEEALSEADLISKKAAFNHKNGLGMSLDREMAQQRKHRMMETLILGPSVLQDSSSNETSSRHAGSSVYSGIFAASGKRVEEIGGRLGWGGSHVGEWVAQMILTLGVGYDHCGTPTSRERHSDTNASPYRQTNTQTWM